MVEYEEEEEEGKIKVLNVGMVFLGDKFRCSACADVNSRKAMGLQVS